MDSLRANLEREAKYFFHTYERIPILIDRGEGVYLIGRDGRRYLDLFAGYAVNALGYGHPGILSAIDRQARRFIHGSNSYLIESQIELAELLVKFSGFAKVFFTNSGTEAIEGALKIARKWGSRNAKSTVIAFSNAFHGRTMGALSLMDRRKYRDGYEPFLENCTILKFNDPAALRTTVGGGTLAVVLEFIQGEGGVIPAAREFVEELRTLRVKHDFLLIADEIQSGLGRTGKLFSFQHYGITPDMVAIAKSLGGGLPLGAILGSERLAAVLEPGVHGSTFGGNPVACAAGVCVLRELMENGVMDHASRMGALLKERLREIQERFPRIVRDVRGEGLMLGMELAGECKPVVESLRGKGVLLNCTNQNVLRFLPPLVITREHIEEACRKLAEVFSGLPS
jgi:acetylornithine/N-succinyldiaminopimelate aminotransferase